MITRCMPPTGSLVVAALRQYSGSTQAVLARVVLAEDWGVVLIEAGARLD